MLKGRSVSLTLYGNVIVKLSCQGKLKNLKSSCLAIRCLCNQSYLLSIGRILKLEADNTLYRVIIGHSTNGVPSVIAEKLNGIFSLLFTRLNLKGQAVKEYVCFLSVVDAEKYVGRAFGRRCIPKCSIVAVYDIGNRIFLTVGR